MLYMATSLWTATHHRIPMLVVMHDNRAYHQEVTHLQRVANRRQRRARREGRGRVARHETLPALSRER
jgi:hypothetical protein